MSVPSLTSDDRVVILAHGKFPDRAKTAVGVLRYAPYDVVAVLDRERAGERVNDSLSDVPDAPIVGDMAAAPDCDALLIGIAPIGGGFDPAWRADVRTALERGCDVVAGLHYQLAEDDEFATLANQHDASLYDVRDPPDDLSVATGEADSVDARVVLTVGTDCSTGKMTTTLALARAAQAAGIDTAVVPTGQTGILIEGWGIAIDRTIADFAAGAVERMVRTAAAEHDLIIVEGQGSIVHPAYSGVTCSILHGSMPDALVLCHVAGRSVIHGYEDTPIPDPAAIVQLYESLAAPVEPTHVIGGSIATHDLDDLEAARTAVSTFEAAIDAPATDPIRFGPDPLLEVIE